MERSYRVEIPTIGSTSVLALIVANDLSTVSQISGEVFGELMLWDVVDNQLIHRWVAHQSEISTVRFSLMEPVSYLDRSLNQPRKPKKIKSSFAYVVYRFL